MREGIWRGVVTGVKWEGYPHHSGSGAVLFDIKYPKGFVTSGYVPLGRLRMMEDRPPRKGDEIDVAYDQYGDVLVGRVGAP